MSVITKVRKLKNIFFEAYEILSGRDESKELDREMNARARKDKILKKKMGRVLSFPPRELKKMEEENKDVSAI